MPSNEDEDAVAMAGRHVREAEWRIDRQARLVAELERDDHAEAARTARELLVTMRKSLDLLREHLGTERGDAEA